MLDCGVFKDLEIAAGTYRTLQVPKSVHLERLRRRFWQQRLILITRHLHFSLTAIVKEVLFVVLVAEGFTACAVRVGIANREVVTSVDGGDMLCVASSIVVDAAKLDKCLAHFVAHGLS